MVHFSAAYVDIENDFLTNGIKVEEPGFYDAPNFLKIERDNNKYLFNYARYVHTMTYSVEYLAKAREIIPFISKLLYGEFIKEYMPGACINLSMVLSRILEKVGIWNYIAKGALTIDFPAMSNITTKYFWPVDITPVTAGHAWVVAPPYNVVDLTIKIQPYFENETKFLPDNIIEGRVTLGEVSYKDIYSPEYREYLRNQGIRNSEMLKRCNPEIVEFSNVFKTNIIDYMGTKLKYIPIASAAPDLPLEKMENIRLDGNYPLDIFRKVILPQI